MLMTMDPDIQKNLEQLGVYDMLKELKTLCVQQAEQELLYTVREFHACKQEEGQSEGFKKFKKKPHKTAKGNQGKGKAKMGYAPVPAPPFAPKPKNPPTPKKDNPAKDAICHQCGKGKYKAEAGSFKSKRAKELLGLIHTDVCGPFRTVSRQAASYFVTCTNDFSSYGYVYLLKHKHEVFETFKVFQKEVENQLGKTIKSLCSDRGSKYMSQEFLDHLNDHGIIAHRTPPYTQQHNGVSEKRNRTLLDMVRSMTSQTTLLKSFLDYALESDACVNLIISITYKIIGNTRKKMR
nr:retrotransposon protein, putative, Ty1-copia subclass [Tanacetum cinerariifolium]